MSTTTQFYLISGVKKKKKKLNNKDRNVLSISNSLAKYKILSRAVHGSGQVGFGPNPDPTRRRRWKVEGPETDRRHHLVESVFGSGGVRVGSIGVKSRRILQTSPESSKNSPKSTKTQ